MDLTYVIGEPGVGKTTLLAAATEGLEWYMGLKPFAHVIYDVPNVIELGPRRAGAFSGTDGLSMSVFPKVVDWLTLAPSPLILGEGDRLASGKFFEAVKTKGYNLTVVHLHAPPEVMEQRRKERAEGNNMPIQNESWVKGRRTKVSRLMQEAHVTGSLKLSLNMEYSIEALLPALDDIPVFKQLKEARS